MDLISGTRVEILVIQFQVTTCRLLTDMCSDSKFRFPSRNYWVISVHSNKITHASNSAAVTYTYNIPAQKPPTHPYQSLELETDVVGEKEMAVRDAYEQAKMAKAHSVFMRLVLPPYTIHFKSPTYMREGTLEVLDKKVCKETVKGTVQNVDVREAIGTDPKFWTELVVLLRAAVPSLERRSFTGWDPSSVDYESTSGALIASNYPGLWKDLERLNDLVSISRNVLTIGDRAQDLAAEYSIDNEIFRVINCCVRVTARGYDGEAGTGDEEKWQWIVNAYKKLLITSLQFLNNFVAQNERRKLMLWVALFDNTSEGVLAPEDIPETSRASLADVPSNPTARPEPPFTAEDFLIACGYDGRQTLTLEGASYVHPNYPWKEYPKEVFNARQRLEGNGLVFYARRMRDMATEDLADEDWLGRDPTYAELHIEIVSRWLEMDDSFRSHWQGMYEDTYAKYKQDCAVYDAKQSAAQQSPRKPASDVPIAQQTQQVEKKLALLEEQLLKADGGSNSVAPLQPPSYSADGGIMFSDQNLHSRPVVADDVKMLFTADAGHRILHSGKAELMKRLEGWEPPDPNLPPSRHPDNVTTRPVKTDPGDNPIERTRSMSRTPPILHPRDPRLLAQREAEARAAREEERRKQSAQNAVDEAFAEHSADEEDEEDEEEEESEEGEEEEEDYPGSTEDGRGLLTDVPLILGPSEIEVLPMLIMSGIVPATNTVQNLAPDEKNALTNMHTVRTHLLLSQSNGRNLLRELLIFVAAWDLREEELYFKFMVKIMEAILKNGLMPYAYHAFRDRSRSKDIISPAQAVIMKLLTCIFRARGEAAKSAGAADPSIRASAGQSTDIANIFHNIHNGLTANIPSRVDLHILNFIFTEFRQHIIPQTCALIFLQGQIHQGRASPEDFPLNLWDMERMYEGVYQYLEFFAVLTEEGVWKSILGDWEMASELVTLLRELEGGIPKMNGLPPASAVLPPAARKVGAQVVHGPVPVHPPPQRSLSADAAMPSSLGPVAVERPFDLDTSPANPTLPPLPLHPPTNPIFEAETPLAYPEDPIIAPLSTHDLQHAADQDEPSDFEWRNLKKLTVLVLSSLIWKNKDVQDQVRDFNGLKVLVDCCRTDEHNPYIREHAIMCLRFAVEGNAENGEIIRGMATSTQRRLLQGGAVTLGGAVAEDVPREVLDTSGYETFMDTKGQVGLRRKDGSLAAGYAHSYPPATSGPSALPTGMVAGPPQATGVVKPRLFATKMTAEKAAELMQNALRDLPLGDKLVTDKQKAEALAKLDKAFESTEKALGRQKASGSGK